jgi:hypothetical protein
MALSRHGNILSHRGNMIDIAGIYINTLFYNINHLDAHLGGVRKILALDIHGER